MSLSKLLSVFPSSRRMSLCGLVFTIWTFFFVPAFTASEPLNCSNVTSFFSERGFTTSMPKEVSDGVARVCGDGPSCCTQGMQQQLGYHSKRQFDSRLTQTLHSMENIFNHRASKFDDFFKEMLSKSKEDFHKMFKNTYGIIYEQHSYVFTDLFEELEKYYQKGRVDLMDAMDNFFNTLYQKMFSILNVQYKFTDKYLECVSDHMKELKPFGDVPDKLSLQLKRSFVATRVYSQALYTAGKIVNNMQMIAMTSNCNRAVAKMFHCPACSGYININPCPNYCTNVMKGCLANHSELDSQWNNFVDAMDKLAVRIMGPFNIEMVVEPINIKISEAIMNFQENAQQVSQKVFTGCGKPELGRRRRSVRDLPYEPRPLQMGNHGPNRSNRKHQTSLQQKQRHGGGGGSSFQDTRMDGFQKIMKETRTQFRNSRDFWKNLPETMCGNNDTKDEGCWNGHSKDKYTTPVVGDGIKNQARNPEVSVEETTSIVVNEQVYALKYIINRVNNAYMGLDVDWIDTEEIDTASSGDGSGYGSGYGSYDPDDTESGSGDSPSPTEPAVTEPPPPQPPITEEDNNLHPFPEHSGKAYNGTASVRNHPNGSPALGLNKALAYYMMPVVIVWYGNAVYDWVQ